MKGMGAGYDKVSSNEPSGPLHGDEDGYDLFELKQGDLLSPQMYQFKRLLIANSIVSFVSALLLVATSIRNTPSTSKFVENFSSYSPAREAVKYVSGTFKAWWSVARLWHNARLSRLRRREEMGN
jgi:hypothetical protein